jgi:hypothetical protein
MHHGAAEYVMQEIKERYTCAFRDRNKSCRRLRIAGETFMPGLKTFLAPTPDL